MPPQYGKRPSAESGSSSPTAPPSKRQQISLPVRSIIQSRPNETTNNGNDGSVGNDALVRQLIANNAPETFSVSAEINELVGRLSEARITPRQLAGASLECPNPRNAKVLVATAISKIDKAQDDGTKNVDQLGQELEQLRKDVKRLTKWIDAVHPYLPPNAFRAAEAAMREDDDGETTKN